MVSLVGGIVQGTATPTLPSYSFSILLLKACQKLPLLASLMSLINLFPTFIRKDLSCYLLLASIMSLLLATQRLFLIKAYKIFVEV
jgi:hypothetical protein